MVNDVPTAKTTGRGSDGETCCNPNGCNTCDALAPGDQCCSGVSETGEVNYKNCCQSPEGTNVTVGIDAHHEGQMCGVVPPKCEDVCNTKTFDIEKNKCGDYDHAIYSTDLSRCEKPVSKEIVICHYTSQDKSSAEIKNIEEKDWYLYAGSGDIKLDLKEGETASVEKDCPLTKKVKLCDPDNRCCKNTNDGPENQTGLYNGVCCPSGEAPVRGSCEKVEMCPDGETVKPEPPEVCPEKKEPLEYCPGTTIVKIPGIDCPKDAVLPTETCPDGSAMPADRNCNKSVAPQTCAQRYSTQDQEASLKCCEDLPGGGTKDHADMYNDVCCPSATKPVDGVCEKTKSCEQFTSAAAKACCDDSSGTAVSILEGNKNGYCCSTKTEGACPKTCAEVVPGDKCCQSIGADNVSVSYKRCCDPATGNTLTEGNDPHDAGQICGYKIDDGKNTPSCSFSGVKLPEFFCGAFKMFVPVMAGQVATFMLSTCLPGFLNPSGDAFFASMLGYMILEIYNAFAYEEGTKLNLAFASNGENDGSKELRSLEKEIKLKLDIAMKKLKSFEYVMLGMHVAEILVIAEALAFAISTIVAIAAASAAAAAAVVGVPPIMPYHAIYNMPYNALGFIMPSVPGPPLIFPNVVPAASILAPSTIVYTQYGVPFIWFQCKLTPPVKPPSDPVKDEGALKALTGSDKKAYLKGLCVGNTAASCAPSGAGAAMGVTSSMCKVTQQCDGSAQPTTICTGMASAVANQVQSVSTGTKTVGCAIACGGGPLYVRVPSVVSSAAPAFNPSVVSSAATTAAGVAGSTGAAVSGAAVSAGGAVMSLDDEDEEEEEEKPAAKNPQSSLQKAIQDKLFSFLPEQVKNNLYTNTMFMDLVDKTISKLFVKESFAIGAWAVVGIVTTVIVSIIITLLLGYFQVYPRLMWDPYIRVAFIGFFGVLMEIINNEYLAKVHILEGQLGQVMSLLSKITKYTPKQCIKNNFFTALFPEPNPNKLQSCENRDTLAHFFITRSYADVNTPISKAKESSIPEKNLCFTGKDTINLDANCDCVKNNSCTKYERPAGYDVDKSGIFKNNPEALKALKEAVQINQNMLNYQFNGQPDKARAEVEKLKQYDEKFKVLKGDLNKMLEAKLKELNSKRLEMIKKSKNGDKILEELKTKGEEASLDHRFIVPSKETMMKSVVGNLVESMTKNLNPEQKNFMKNNDFSKVQASPSRIFTKNDLAKSDILNQGNTTPSEAKVRVKPNGIKTAAVTTTTTSSKPVIYNIIQEDINKNKDLDLFKIISNRIRLKHYEK